MLFKFNKDMRIIPWVFIISSLFAISLQGVVIETDLVPDQVYFVFDQHRQSQRIEPFRPLHENFKVNLGEKQHESFLSDSSYFILVQAKKIHWSNWFKLRDKVVIKRYILVFVKHLKFICI